MNKKRLFTICIFVAIAATIVFFIVTQHRSSVSIPTAAKDIVVTNIRRVNVEGSVDSYLAWMPGKPNSVAAISIFNSAGEGDIVYSYNLDTGERKKLYDLKDYGIARGNGFHFFWSSDGKRIITANGGIANLDNKTGYWISPPAGAKPEDLNVVGISPDGKKLLVDAWNNGPMFVNVDSGQYSLFSMRSDVFSAPFSVMAWNQFSKWIAAGGYDPDHLPKNAIDAFHAPQALYLLSADSQKARLIARNIDGNVDSVTFSPDGNKLIWSVAHNNGRQSIFIANLDGSEAHEIFSNADLPPEYNIPSTSNLLWSPDGSRIVYVGPSDESFHYYFWVLTLGNINSFATH